MQIGFYFNQSRCTGCYTCVVACKDWHDIPAGPASWIKVSTVEEGIFPNLHLSYLFTSCWHCATPVCAAVCPAKAITKREADGIVIIDREACIGGEKCKFACLKACRYRAPQFGKEANAKMQKCDLCLERWQENRKPICVEGCPMRALDAGPLDDLRMKYGNIQEGDGFVSVKRVGPSVVMKPKRQNITGRKK
jgi:anaerobic dimethyl sulfoxide reductase subunit B